MPKQPRGRSIFLGVLMVAAAGMTGGCGTDITAEREVPPPGEIAVLVIGAIEADDPHWERVARQFRRALVEHLQERLDERNSSIKVVSRRPARLAADATVVSGRFTDVDDGSEALRFLIGVGLGALGLEAHFEIRDANGALLAAFAEEATSRDGTGMGSHWSPIYTEDLVDGFANKASGAIDRWSRGEPLEPSIWEVMGDAVW